MNENIDFSNYNSTSNDIKQFARSKSNSTFSLSPYNTSFPKPMMNGGYSDSIDGEMLQSIIDELL